MKEKKEDKNQIKSTPIAATIHHSYKLEAKGNHQKNKIYFSRLRGYRDRD